jgi:glycosyltransferase involved in cell wall biosynthesis
MHICFLTNEYPVPGQSHGGIGSFLGVFCPALVNQGHQVSIINGTYNGPSVVKSNGVNIYYFPFSRKKGLAWFFNFKLIREKIIFINQENPIDVIEGSELSFSFLPKILNIQYVIRLHGGHHFFAEGEQRPLNKWKAYQEKRSFKKADGFIAVSNYVLNHTQRFLKIEPRPVRVIMYPIALHRFLPESFDKIVPFRVVFAGTLVEKKGIRQLILAMPKVIQKFPKAELHIYGRDWKDRNANSFKEKLLQIIPISIKEKIIFFGPVDQEGLPAIYTYAHVCAFPSHIETLGLVAPEAMAMQRAVLYSTSGPGPEVIEHGESGWLANPHSPDDIADKLVDIFNNDIEMKRRATNGLNKVNNQFNISLILNENLNFYRKLKTYSTQ